MGGKLAKWIASPVEKGVLPQLCASAGSSVQAGDFYGPKYGLMGPPKRLKIDKSALDQRIADKLWQVSEEATGVAYSWSGISN